MIRSDRTAVDDRFVDLRERSADPGGFVAIGRRVTVNHENRRPWLVRLRRYGPIVIGVAIFTACIAVLNSTQRLDQLPMGAILLCQPLTILAVVALGIRLAMLFRWMPHPYRGGVSATFIGGGFGMLLPFRAGEALKILVLRKYVDTTLPKLLGVILLERAGDVIVLALFGTVVLFGKTSLDQFLILAVFVASLFLVRPAGAGAGRLLKRRKSALLQNGGDWIQTTSGLCSARSLAFSALISIPGQMLCVAAAMTVMYAVEPEQTTLRTGIALWFGTGIGLGLSIAPASLGTFEAGGTAALVALGWPLESALEATLSLHIAYLICVAPLGGLLAGFEVPGFFRRRSTVK